MKSATMTLVQRPIALAVTSALLLSACATQPRVHVPLAYEKSPEPTEYLQPPEANGLNVKVMPPTPLDLRSNVRATTALAAPAEHEEATITLGFDQVPLPVFIQTVYGSTLKKNFSMDPAVASRQDLVSLRTSTPQTPTQVAETVRMLLKSYGVAVSNLGGFFRIAPDNTQSGYTPELRRGRALPDVPLAMRPIFQLVDINTIMQHDAATTLKQLFGNRITIQEDATRNALLLSGQTDDIRAALDMIQVIDQPLMAGQQSVRITPTFWGVDEMTRRLGDVLNTEGYGVSVLTSNVTFNQYTRSPIVLMPVGPINSIMIFCRDRATLEHVVKWADELDQPSINKNSGFFSYQVKHSDAQALATILQGLTNGTTPYGKVVKASKVVVNPATNSLIFEGGAGEYSQYLSLLRELDKPTRSALIEVTVAQIDLSTAQQMGIQWGLAPKSINGTQYTYTADVNGIGVSSSTSSSTASTASSSSSSSTSGSTTDGAGGLVLQLLDSARAVRAQISALATQTKAKVLSTPSVMARNGEAAQITVGQDVPILSSQQSNASTGGGLLQTVQYRNVGVILTVRPVIHSSGRIDLDVSQEVSNVAAGSGVNSNPIFSSRKVNT
jgi:general secretion pathway protein D